MTSVLTNLGRSQHLAFSMCQRYTKVLPLQVTIDARCFHTKQNKSELKYLHTMKTSCLAQTPPTVYFRQYSIEKPKSQESEERHVEGSSQDENSREEYVHRLTEEERAAFRRLYLHPQNSFIKRLQNIKLFSTVTTCVAAPMAGYLIAMKGGLIVAVPVVLSISTALTWIIINGILNKIAKSIYVNEHEGKVKITAFNNQKEQVHHIADVVATPTDKASIIALGVKSTKREFRVYFSYCSEVEIMELAKYFSPNRKLTYR